MLAVAQPWEQRKSPETVTETSTVFWKGGFTYLPPHTVWCRQQTEPGSDHGYSGEEGATIFSWNRHQVGSFVTRETRSKVMSLTAPVTDNDHHKDRCFPLKLQVEPFVRIRTSCDRAQERSCEQGVREAGTGQAGDIQRAREQPSWVIWTFSSTLTYPAQPQRPWSVPLPWHPWCIDALQPNTKNAIQTQAATEYKE